MRYFCAVARAGSFTKAAEAEGITQPSLSQQIQKLETELNARLFDRLGRRVRLTSAGQAFWPEAVAALSHVRAAQTAVSALREGVAGPLKIGAIPTVLPYFLAPRLGDFAARYPDVDIQLREDVTQRLIEDLQNGDLDIALVGLPVKSPGLIARELFRERLFVAVPLDHAWVELGEADIGNVDGERLLLLKEGHCFRDEVLTVCTRAKARFRSVFESDQLGSLFPLVASGFGVSLVPEMASGQAAGCCLLPFNRPVFRRVGYLRRRGVGVGKAMAAFTRWLMTESAPLRAGSKSLTRN